MGTTISQLSKMGAIYDDEAGLYVVRNPPVKNNSFDEILVLASPRVGVCKVVGLGKEMIVSGDGQALRSAFSNFNNILNTKYGVATSKFDYLKSSSIWNDSNDWMMGLRMKDRTLAHYWMRSKGAKLTNNIGALMLEAKALSSTKGYIVVGYEYTNYDKCNQEKEVRDGSGL